MKRLLVCIPAFLLVLVLTIACSRVPDHAADGNVTVVATIFPLYDFARQVGGEAAVVSLLLPPGVEAHAYEPTPRDMIAINTADIVIYAGPDMDPWMADIIAGIDTNNTMIIDASSCVDTVAGEHAESVNGRDHAGTDEEQHHHDPHFWLDFGCAAATVDIVQKALCARDPAHSEHFITNAEQYKRQLAELDTSYREAIRRCRHKTVIYGGHFAFGYLARRYGLTFLSPYAGYSPNAEPRPRDITKILAVMRAENITYVFHEELIDPRVARILAEETGATLLLLHGAHNVTKKDLDDGVTFLAIMADNLERLKQGLGCQ